MVRCAVAFAYRYAAIGWFAEMVDDPDLARRRGQPPGEPLPARLGLLTAEGRLAPSLRRENLVALADFLATDDLLLAWCFPNGLDADMERLLREELAILRQQEWSPHRAVLVALEQWPEDGPTEIDFTLEAAERDLLAALEAFLAEPEDDADDSG